MSSQKKLDAIAEELGGIALPMIYFLRTMESKLYMEKLEKNIGISDAVREFSECVYSIRNATPMSEYAREAIGKAYEVMTGKLKPSLDKLKSYNKWEEKFWKDDTGFFGDYVDGFLKKTEEPLKYAIEHIASERDEMDNLYKDGKLSKEPPMKRKRGPWDLAAMIIVLGLGFAALNWLGDLGTVLPGGELQGVVTGFYLLPGGPFVSSMQMVLFLLASAVVIVYLFGKSAGEW